MLKIQVYGTEWSESEWNPANFEGVILQYQSRIYNFIYGLVREKPLAQDLTQDTFLRAYLALCKEAADNTNEAIGEAHQTQTQTETTPTLIAWLYKIARNTCISELRRRKVVQFSSFWQSEDVGIEYEINAPARTGLLANGSELENQFVLRDELEQAIAKVGRVRLTALLMHLHGYSYEEISRLRRTSLSSVKSQIFRAKQELRNSFLIEPDSLAQQLPA